MDFSQKLMELRRSKGMSQEQLGEKLGVTRQTISKWELGQTTPEMEKLAAISELFGITTDELIKGEAPKVSSSGFQAEKNAPVRLGLEYKSSRTVRGIPLVHVNVGLGRRTAKGIIAVGNKAVGVISAGFLSVGVISAGLLCAGVLAIGTLSAGIIALGAVAAGVLAFGGVAVGVVALGGLAVGVYSIGGAAFASEIAAGGLAHAKIAIGDSVQGTVEIPQPIPAEQARALITEHSPGTPGVLTDIFSAIAENFSTVD